MFRLIKVFAGCTCLCAGFGCDVAHVYVLFKQVVRLSMVKDGAVAVTQMGEGNYESRQRRVSYWNNMKIVIYNDRNGLYSKWRIK